MDIPGIVRSALNTAFTVVKSLSEEDLSYRVFTDSDSTTFDPTTGGSNLTTTDYSVDQYILTDFSQTEISEGVGGPQHWKLLVPTTSLTVSPTVGNAFVIDTSVAYIDDDNTRNNPPIKRDPTGELWIIRLRKP